MERISTYIINLKSSFVRKQYMNNLLKQYSFLNIQYIEAIDGKLLSDEDINNEFDKQLCLKQYGRILKRGEIGCVLSHRKCYQTLLSTSNSYTLILEDDIHLMRPLDELQMMDLDRLLNVNTPTIFLLSGDYWFYKRRKVVDVYDAIGAYAYFINRAAALVISSIPKPYNVADDWTLYKQHGVKLKAIYPYLVDANVNMDLLGSDVHQDVWGIDKKKMSKMNLFRTIKNGLLKRGFSSLGHFESKIRVINNVVID